MEIKSRFCTIMAFMAIMDYGILTFVVIIQNKYFNLKPYQDESVT